VHSSLNAHSPFFDPAGSSVEIKIQEVWKVKFHNEILDFGVFYSCFQGKQMQELKCLKFIFLCQSSNAVSLAVLHKCFCKFNFVYF